MKVFVGNVAVIVAEGMSVRHALLAAGYQKALEHLRVRDEWGNEVGLDGALHEGQTLIVDPKPL